MGGSCCILGNGPSLKKENTPRDMLLVGVNRSPEVVWAPILTSCDTSFIKGLRERGPPGPPVCLYAFPDRVLPDQPCARGTDSAVAKLKRMFLVDIERAMPRTMVVQDCPFWIGYSGLFAMWFASQKLGMSSLFLLGFDYGYGHFYNTDKCERDQMQAKTARFKEEFPDVSIWRWVVDEWINEYP